MRFPIPRPAAVSAAIAAGAAAVLLFVVFNIPGHWVDGWPAPLWAVAYAAVGALVGLVALALRVVVTLASAGRGVR